MAFADAIFPVSAARTGSDSSHGSASEIPAPRRNVRREIGWRTKDDCLDVVIDWILELALKSPASDRSEIPGRVEIEIARS